MNNVPEVETAKALMTEAMHWSVVKWLMEKKRVRRTADRANAALDQRMLRAKQRWPASVTSAHESQETGQHQSRTPADQHLHLLITKFRRAEREAYAARANAESTFDEAEILLSTQRAREGCSKAIDAWDLLEKAILNAEQLSQK